MKGAWQVDQGVGLDVPSSRDAVVALTGGQGLTVEANGTRAVQPGDGAQASPTSDADLGLGMTLSLTALLVPTYRQMLRALTALLDKARRERPAGTAEELLVARLALDMYPLAAQFRFAAFQAQEVVCRLRGEPEPDALDAGAGLAIALELPDGLAFDLTGAQYARD